MSKKFVASVLAVACLVGSASVPAAMMTSSEQVISAARNDVKQYGRLSYVENDDGTLTIVNCAKDVVWVDLDGTIDGKRISAVGDNAFLNCSDLKYVHLGDSIMSIGQSAFSETGIERITIPPYVKTINVSAFDGCENLSTVCMFNYRKNIPVLENHIFDDAADDITLYCPIGSPHAAYAINHNLNVKQSNYYWVDTPPADNKKDDDGTEEVSEGSTEPDAESPDEGDTKVSYDNVNTGSGAGNAGSSQTASVPSNAQSKPLTNDTANVDSSQRPVSPATGVRDEGIVSLAQGEVSGGAGAEMPDEMANQSLDDRYKSFHADVQLTYQNGKTVSSSKYGSKIIKDAPAGLSFPYSWKDVGGGYMYTPSDIAITKKDYVVLCNCVAMEYGADWVPEWEMALVAEVVFNRYKSHQYASLYDTITAPNAFEHSDWYADLDTFSSRVSDRVINAVNTYLAYPDYFNEGYTAFRGDGTWNYFW